MDEKLDFAVQLGEQLGVNFIEARHDSLIVRILTRLNDQWKDIDH